MYWIEVDFTNGKTIRREYEDLNDSFAVLRRYNNGRTKPQWNSIRSGYKDIKTGEWKRK